MNPTRKWSKYRLLGALIMLVLIMALYFLPFSIPSYAYFIVIFIGGMASGAIGNMLEKKFGSGKITCKLCGHAAKYRFSEKSLTCIGCGHPLSWVD